MRNATVKKKSRPFDFVFDELFEINFHTKPMFGCLAFYIENKLYFISRDRESSPQDNGLWLSFPDDAAKVSMKTQYPILRDIALFESGPTAWQVLPKDSENFETLCFEICDLIKKKDPRLGKVPNKKNVNSRKRKKSK